MKILLAGFSWYGGFTDYCSRALKALDNEVYVISINSIAKDVVDHRLSKTIDSKLAKLLGNRKSIRWRLDAVIDKIVNVIENDEIINVNKDLIIKCKQYKPDLIMVLTSSDCLLKYEFLAELRKSTEATIVSWYTDDPFRQYENSACASLYDKIFVYDRGLIQDFKKRGCKNVIYLPNAGDNWIFKPVQLSSYDFQKYACDISYIGTSYCEDGGGVLRGAIIDGLLKKYRVNVYGDSGWKNLINHFPQIQHAFSNSLLPVSETNKAYNASTINLNIHHPQIRLGTSTKTFEIALSCGFQLVDKNDELNNLFDTSSELICYESHEELNSLINYYLKNESERIKIAKKAHDHALKDHTFINRMKTILSNTECLVT